MVGSYDDLESALAAATDKYGTTENDWLPITTEDLPEVGHGPPPFDR